jgi:hypothetical protein
MQVLEIFLVCRLGHFFYYKHYLNTIQKMPVPLLGQAPNKENFYFTQPSSISRINLLAVFAVCSDGS